MKNFRHKWLSLLALAAIVPAAMSAQGTTAINDTIYNPKIVFTGTPSQYEIAGIRVEGVENYDENIIIGYSGLALGQRIDIPGDDIKAAAKRFWRQGLFSKVQILVEKIYNDKYLNLGEESLTPRFRYLSRKSITTRLGSCLTCASSLACPRSIITA